MNKLDSTTGTYEMALHVLQTSSSSFDARMESLRFLQSYVDGKLKVDANTRRRINQAVLEGVLEIVMTEERTSDLRKRQLMRTECFLILANLLDSQALFGDTEKKLRDIFESNREREEEDLHNHDLSLWPSESSEDRIPASKSAPRIVSTAGALNGAVMEEIDEAASPGFPLSPLNSISQLKSRSTVTFEETESEILGTTYRINGTFDKSKRRHKGKQIHKLEALERDTSDLSLIKDKLTYHPRLFVMDKKLKPRPSTFYDSEYENDTFVPGLKPTDWYEQDKKLGYQKSRMWFPVAGLGFDNDMAPPDRPGPEKQIMPDRVVHEYMQMKALLSYVGDVVAPYANPNVGGVAAANIPLGGVSKRTHGAVNPNLYKEALRQAVSVWSPLIGSHLPDWVRKKHRWTEDHSSAIKSKIASDTAVAAAQFADQEGSIKSGNSPSVTTATSGSVTASATLAAESIYSTSTAAKRSRHIARAAEALTAATNHVEKKIVFTKGVLRRLLRKELKGAKQTSHTLKETLETLLENDVESDTVEKYQAQLDRSLQSQKDTLLSSVDAFKTLTRETIKLQYSLLPQRYLLIVDGKKASSRRLVALLVNIFCRTRRLSLLTLFFGTWKICLVEHESKLRRPKYAKTAACHLMGAWVVNRKFKRLRLWVQRWQKEVVRRIFYERNKAAVPIQTMYRMWRDRQIFINLHKVGPYNGPLSDIFLAPYRPQLRFAIPRLIRNSRRMYWMAAIVIQSSYRCLVVWRVYRRRLRQIILIQSYGRMWPIRVRFLQLRAITIKCQAWARRTVKRKQYIRLKLATIIVQKYVRRYLAILRKFRMFEVGWVETERRMYAAIKIQCRVRIRRAKLRIKRIVFNRKLRVWAALVIQKYWYSHKGAFHTYFLMCCYRACGEDDVNFMKFVTTRGRDKAVRKIQAMYRERYDRRIISSAIKLQGWYRGRRGYTYVDVLRRRKWAARKLHHWARGMMRKKNQFIRKIQRWWWRLKPGRLKRHLEYKAKCMDKAFERLVGDLRYGAASIIQAFVHGVWCRRWAKLYKAAVKIQRPLRFFLARKRWKREKRMRIVRVIERYVNNFVGRAVRDRSLVLVRQHIKMLIKPQALARGYIVRNTMFHAREFAFRFGLAVVKVQRFWRRTGSIGKAVQEVMAMRRLELNPYVSCICVHEVIMEMKKDMGRYYGLSDIRSGMRVPEFLLRLGCPELVPMFSRKQFLYVNDMRVLTMSKLSEMYGAWMEKLSKASKGKPAAKDKGEPVDTFRSILEVLKPKPNTRHQKQLLAISNIAPVQECMTPAEFNDMVQKAFAKRFGKQLQVRAQNLARSLTDSLWTSFNNYKGVTDAVTKAQVLKSFSLTSDSAGVKNALDELRGSIKRAEDDTEWDKERIRLGAETLQYAIDRTLQILPPHSMFWMWVEKAVVRVQSYRRRFAFILARIKKEAKEALKNAGKKKKAKKPPAGAGAESDTGGIGAAVDVVLAEDQMGRMMTVFESTEKNYLGPDSLVEFEMNVSICKIYSEVLDRLYFATSGVQSIKSIWFNSSLKRFNAKARLQAFLVKSNADYQDYRHADHVKATWLKLRRKETSKKKLELIMESVARQKAAIEEELSHVPKYGWEITEDEQGAPWCVDLAGVLPPTSDRQLYSIHQYRKNLIIQRQIRRFLFSMAERRRLKEEARLHEIEEEEARLAREKQFGARPIAVSVSVEPRNMTQFLKKSPTGLVDGVTKKSVDELLPRHLQLHPETKLISGSWAFMQPGDNGPFEVVVLFKIRDNGDTCDCKSIKGNRFLGVKKSNIFRMNFQKGSIVEARFKGELDFYKGKIAAIVDAFDGSQRYSIVYEDGAKEDNLTKDLLRFPRKALEDLLKERTVRKAALVTRYKRMQYYESIRSQRLERTHKSAVSHSARFERCWAATVQGGGASVVSMLSASVDDSVSVAASNNTGLVKANETDSERVSESKSQARKKGKSYVARPTETVFMSFVKSMLQNSDVLIDIQQNSVNVKVQYIRRPLRYGWVTDTHNGEVIYYNIHSFEQSKLPPRYTASDEYAIRKIQSVGRMRLARLAFKKVLLRETIESIVSRTILKGRRVGCVGFGLEGAAVLHTLRRLGYNDLAAAVDENSKDAAGNLKDALLTIEKFISMPPFRLEEFGIKGAMLVRTYQTFAEWWTKTPVDKRNEAAKFFNSFTSPDDARSIQECVIESEDKLIARFLRQYPAGANRTRAACKALTVSNYPISVAQLEAYIKKYNDTAELARDRLGEITNQPTTHTWVEEGEVFKIFRAAVRRVGIILGNLGVPSLRARVSACEKHADSLFALAESLNEAPRIACTGPEGKAALVLRVDGLEFMKSCIRATILLQKRIRGFTNRSKYLKWIKKRADSQALLKRVARGYLGRKVSNALRLQQYSPWEQLWDTRRNMLYYYNRSTMKSSYEEPFEPFRPLVRDRFSSTLMQAWPHLDAGRGGTLLVKGIDANVMSKTQSVILFKPAQQCSVCIVRRCVRYCRDCFDPEVSDAPNPDRPIPYCFPCFNRVHTEDPEKEEHTFDDANETTSIISKVTGDTALVEEDGFGKTGSLIDFLRCCMCDAPATRKCLGILDDAQIDALCSDLQRSPPEKWRGLLLSANVGSEGKLTLLLDMLNAEPSQRMLTTAQLQQVRTALERTRAECDECYCATCYQDVHSGGKRSMHRWIGFKETSPVCKVCTRSPAQMTCTDCDNIFCSSCFAVFHNMGRKRRHRFDKIMEEMLPSDVPCEVCGRRAGSVACGNKSCEVCSCDSCYEFVHRLQCSYAVPVEESKDIGVNVGNEALALRALAEAAVASGARSVTPGNRAQSPQKGAQEGRIKSPMKGRQDDDASSASSFLPPVCVSCGELADQKCVQCHDYYCSKTWMGNPGCFKKFHSRGNRQKHMLVPVEKPKEPSVDTGAERGAGRRGRADGSRTDSQSTVGTLPSGISAAGLISKGGSRSKTDASSKSGGSKGDKMGRGGGGATAASRTVSA